MNKDKKEGGATPHCIAETLEVLRKGGVILYPTDTVWGLGCDASDPEAVARIFSIKKRSDSKSLVLLASDLDMVARFVKEVPDMAVQLVEVNDRPSEDGFLHRPCPSLREADSLDFRQHLRRADPEDFRGNSGADKRCSRLYCRPCHRVRRHRAVVFNNKGRRGFRDSDNQEMTGEPACPSAGLPGCLSCRTSLGVSQALDVSSSI